MTISEFAPDTNCRRNGSGIISDFDSTAPPGIGSRDHSRRLDSSPVEQAKKWLIPIHRRANLTGTTSGVQSLDAAGKSAGATRRFDSLSRATWRRHFPETTLSRSCRFTRRLCNLQAELMRAFDDGSNLLFPVPGFVVLLPFIDVFLPVLE